MQEKGGVFEARRNKLDQWRENGVNPYSNDFKVPNTTGDVVEKYGEADAEALENVSESFTIAGRIIMMRVFGKAGFMSLQDRKGRLQAFVSKGEVGDEAFAGFKAFDVGDIVGVTGVPFRTKTNELTLKASAVRLITKNMRPLPEKWHGLTDTETRYRQRYVDLIVNPDVANVFRIRAKIIQGLRNFLVERDFLEVETPMLHSIAGGALAKPFVTHHNALDMDLFLRIAPELHLKRLVVGGFERVFEINRNFRNEGISTRHNPEFTMLEFYLGYATYEDLITLSEEMIGNLAKEITGDYKVEYQGETLDFSPPWQRLTPKEAILKFSDITEADLDGYDALLQTANKLHIENTSSYGEGKLLMEIFEAVAEDKLVQPTFLVDFPLEVSPLARKKESDPTLTDRFEIYVAGKEIGNAFSELNDPEDQRSRFEAQLEARAAGDEEAHEMDDDYIRALEYGMPPAAGEGIGIDRLTMLLTNCDSIRDVILFPQLRKEN